MNQADMSCSDPECPACKVQSLLQEFVDLGAGPDEIIPMVMSVLDDMFENLTLITDEGTVH